MNKSSFCGEIFLFSGGLLYIRDSSNLQYVTSSSMILLIYSKILISAGVRGVQCGSKDFSITTIKAFAKSQVSKILQLYDDEHAKNHILSNIMYQTC